MPSSRREPVPVRTSRGTVVGTRSDGVACFAGIPFAGPLRAARFRAASAAEPWRAPLDASHWAPYTPQVANPDAVPNRAFYDHRFGTDFELGQSESGLYLNLWAPTEQVAEGHPVVVWIHGGGFTTGAATHALREVPDDLVRNEQLVVVAPSHRLGALGYLFLDDLTGARLRTANLGMRDLVLALEWVRDSIRGFGGDPARVTLAGESGGAAKIQTLMAMPSADGLFHRAIMMAGAMASGHPIASMSREAATDRSRRILERAGVDPTSAEEIHGLPTSTIVAAEAELDDGLLAWGPVCDGSVVAVAPETVGRHAVASPVPILLGNSSHEADLLTAVGEGRRLLDAGGARERIGARADRLFADYATRRPDLDPAEVRGDLVTDWMFRQPGIALADARAGSTAPTFAYSFDWVHSDGRQRATHGSETPFLFGSTPSVPMFCDDPGAARISRTVQRYLGSFARTGRPASASDPHWPPYGPDRLTMSLGATPRVIRDPRSSDRLAWRASGSE